MSDQVCAVQIYAIYTCASCTVVLILYMLWLQGILLSMHSHRICTITLCHMSFVLLFADKYKYATLQT
jgi:hypothetical protein